MIKPDLLAKYKVKNNLLTRLDQAERKIRSVESADFQAPSLDAFAPAVGEVTDMRILAGDGDLEGGTYSGTAMVWPSIEINGNTYALVGMNSGTLEFGLDALTGRALFAGGDGIIDQNGLNLNGIRYALRHYATDGNGANARYGRYEMMFEKGKTIPSLALTYMDGVVSTELVVNGGFETGNMNNWTPVNPSYWSANSGFKFTGVYSARCVELLSNTTVHEYASSDRILITATKLYKFQYNSYGTWAAYYNGKVSCSLLWYNDPTAGSLIKTDILQGSQATNSWINSLTTLLAPVGAQSVVIRIDCTLTSSGSNQYPVVFLDDFSLTAVTFERKILFGPEPEIYDGTNSWKILAGVKELFVPLAPTISLVATASGNCDNGAHKVKITYLDSEGETTASPTSNSVTVDGTHKQITVPLPIGPWGTTSRNVYMTAVADQNTWLLAATIADNTTTTINLSVADASLGAGEPQYNTSGSRPLYPRHQTVMGHDFLAFNAAGTGIPLVLTNTASQVRYGFYANLAAADANDLDRYKADLFLEAGTYTVVFYGLRGTTSGKVDLYIDGALIAGGPHDLYNGSTDYDYTFSVSGVVITGSDYHLLEWRVNGKNASSSDYRVLLTCTSVQQANY